MRLDAALEELIEHGMPGQVALVLAYRGEADRAFEWLDKPGVEKDPDLVDIVVEPLMAPIHQDARWVPELRRFGKAPEQLGAIEFEVKVPQQ